MRGNTGSGPLKALDESSLLNGGQRWRFVPLRDRLTTTSARPSALPSVDFELAQEHVHPDDVTFSHFSATLTACAETNLTATFSDYLAAVRPLAASLPLVFRNRAAVFARSLEALHLSTARAAHATPPLAACLTALAKDLGPQHFHPFFAPLVSAFARVFDSASAPPASDPSAAETPHARQHSVFWDPEVSLVPLFSTLAEITKSHVQVLAADPQKTVRDLLPLIANSHFRVREMTAEACLGYLLKKTRDPDVLKALSQSIVRTAADPELPYEQAPYAVDGLGVTLFEAARIPSGRLHSRYAEVLSAALRALREESSAHVDDDAEPPWDTPPLAVLCRCFTAFCRHVANAADAQGLVDVFVKELQAAAEEVNAVQVGSVAFFLRKYFQRGGGKVLLLLDRSNTQKVLNALGGAVQRCPNESRVVYECLGAICSIFVGSTDSSIRRSSSKAFSFAASKVAISSRLESVLAGMALVLRMQTMHAGKLRDLSLPQTCASFCDRVARLSPDHVEGGPSNADSISSTALKLALAFLEEDTRTFSAESAVTFRSRTLEKQVTLVLSNLPLHADSYVEELRNKKLLTQSLCYLQYVQVQDRSLVFEKLFQIDFLTSEERAHVIRAFSCQYREDVDRVPATMAGRADDLVRGMLDDLSSSTNSPDILTAIENYVRLRGVELSKTSTGDHDQLLSHMQMLSQNLSSPNSELREKSIALLALLGAHMEGRPISESGKASHLDDSVDQQVQVQSKTEALRSALASEGGSLANFFDVLNYVTRCPKSLGSIDFTLRILRELQRSLRHSKGVASLMVFASIQFSIGLLRTPFKPLWSTAGDIWCAAAAREEQYAMMAMIKCLHEAQGLLLQEWSQNAGTDDGDEDGNHEDLEDNPSQDEVSTPIAAPGMSRGESLDCLSSRKRKVDIPSKAKKKNRNVSKRKRARDRDDASKAWDQAEWRHDCPLRYTDDADRLFQYGSSAVAIASTDSSTLLQEVFRTLIKEPKFTLKYRPVVIQSYLTLSPSLFSRRTGDVLATACVSLLEKMGGLKCCETDKSLESSMRGRLLSDLARPSALLQVASMRCLCASRSPALKPRRDSFLRLIDDSSFREELAVLTEELSSRAGNEEQDAAMLEANGDVTDVMVRICFSKMKGKRARLDSRRLAVLSFLVSKFPADVAIPRIVDLVVSPIADVLDKVAESIPESDVFWRNQNFPAPNVQRAMLSSIESLLKQCKRSMPLSCWHKLGVSSFALFRNGGSGAAGQSMRSRVLHIVSDMCLLRPEETSFLVLPIVKAVRLGKFETNTTTASQGTPAFLYFVAAIFKSGIHNTQWSVVRDEEWAVRWGLQLMAVQPLSLLSVVHALDVAERIVAMLSNKGTAFAESSLSTLTTCLAAQIRGLLKNLIENAHGDRSVKKEWTPIFDRSLLVLGQLVEVAVFEGNTLATVADGLTSYLENSVNVSTSTVSALKTLRAVARRVCEQDVLRSESDDPGTVKQIVQNRVLRLIPMFGIHAFCQNTDAFVSLCTVFDNLDMLDMKSVMHLLRDMNAMSAAKLESPDLDRRIGGLNVVIRIFKEGMKDIQPSIGDPKKALEVPQVPQDDNEVPVKCNRDALLALLYGCVSAIRVDDTAVRGTASYALQMMSKWISLSQSEAATSAKHQFFKSVLVSAVSAKTLMLRREYFRSLGELARLIPALEENPSWSGYRMFPLLKGLSNGKDMDSDFFENVVHLQAHRRGRALRQVVSGVLRDSGTSAAGDSLQREIKSSFALEFSLPLAFQVALEACTSNNQDRQRLSRHNEARESSQKDVNVWACAVAGSSARCLKWHDYRSWIQGMLRKLKTCTDEDQLHMLYKLLVEIVEAFPELDSANQELRADIQGFLSGFLLPKLLEHVSAGGTEGERYDAVEVLSEKNGRRTRGRPPTVFRAPVAIAAGHLLARLPSSTVDSLIPLLVTPLVTALRCRLFAARDGAKKALTSVVLTLGPKYLPYVLRQVLSALSEGYRKDACVYVIHSLLIGVQDFINREAENVAAAVYPIDEAVPIITTYLVEELESGVSVIGNDFQDPNASSSRQREASARATRAYECVELLGRLATFDSSALSVISPFEEVMVRTSSSKLLSRLDIVLQKLLRGFSKNHSVLAADAFKVSHQLLTEGAKPKGKELIIAICEPRSEEDKLRNTGANRHRMISFGMLLLGSTINKSMDVLMGSDTESRELQAMVEPFLPLVVQSLRTSQDSLTLNAVNTAQKLLKLPLANKASVAEEMSETIVSVLSQKAGLVTYTEDLFNACLRAAAALIYEVGGKQFKVISRDRVEALVGISCNCLENGNPDARSSALALLKATVTAEVMIPVVYDAMQRVNKMAIRAQSSALRASCTALSIKFMVSFPLGSKRVRQHLEFFVRNLNYELPNGRLAALQAISTVILKFPAEVLEAECEYLLIALAASASKDRDAECRSVATSAVQLLFERVPVGRRVTDMIKIASVLLGVSTTDNEDKKLDSLPDSEVQLSGALALFAACKSGRMNDGQLRSILQVLVLALDGQDHDADWETTYALLQGIEIALRKQQDRSRAGQLALQLFMRPLWERLPVLLLHKQQWIRLSSARLLGKHLSVSGGRDSSPNEANDTVYFVLWAKTGIVRAILKSSCLQLEANHLSEDLAQQCLKNLLCIAHVTYNNADIADVAESDSTAIGGSSEAKEEGSSGLRWLLARMSGLAVRFGETEAAMLRRGCSLRFLLVTSKWWGFDWVQRQKEFYIAPVVKILESGQGSHETSMAPINAGVNNESEKSQMLSVEDLRTMASTLQEALIDGLGATEYYGVYQTFRQKREDQKQARKRQAVLELAVDPERAAKRRRKKADARKHRKAGRDGNRRPAVTVWKDPRSRLTEDL